MEDGTKVYKTVRRLSDDRLVSQFINEYEQDGTKVENFSIVYEPFTLMRARTPYGIWTYRNLFDAVHRLDGNTCLDTPCMVEIWEAMAFNCTSTYNEHVINAAAICMYKRIMQIPLYDVDFSEADLKKASAIRRVIDLQDAYHTALEDLSWNL